MIDFKKLIERYNEEYKKRIADNKEKLIEAFVKYYGEEHREYIKERFNDIGFSWYVSKYISYMCNEMIPFLIQEQRVEDTLTILKEFGFNNTELDYDKTEVLLNNDKLLINPSKISNVSDMEGNRLDDILRFLFGENELFDYDYKNNKLYNFFSYDEETRNNFIKEMYGNREVPEDILIRIRKAIAYMDSIKGRKEDEKKYLDFYLFDACIKDGQQHKRKNIFKRALNKILGKQNPIEKGRIIGYNDPRVISEKYKNTLQSLELDSSITNDAVQTMVDEKFSIILFPILYVTDEVLIHEINHVITGRRLAMNYEKDGKPVEISKYGIEGMYGTDDETYSEEILNDISAYEITDIFHKLGGNIFDNKYNFPAFSTYSLVFPLIEPFYQKYKKLIIETRITENANLLYSRIDKNVLKEYKELIDSVMEFIHSKNGKFREGDVIITYDQLKLAKELIEKMDKVPTEKVELDEYVKDLEKQGKKVTIINHDARTGLDCESPRKR